MRLGIVGTHDFKDRPDIAEAYEKMVRLYIRRLPLDTVIVSGGAKGVDSWAEDEARKRHMGTKVYPVDRKGLPPYGTKEGRKEFSRRAKARNELIVKNSDALIAFQWGNSPGTGHTISLCKRWDLQVPHAVMELEEPDDWTILGTESPGAFFVVEPGN